MASVRIPLCTSAAKIHALQGSAPDKPIGARCHTTSRASAVITSQHRPLISRLSSRLRGSHTLNKPRHHREVQAHRHRQALAISAVCVPGLVTFSVLPTCLGFIRSEYTVSYGYGTATAACAALIYYGAAATGCSPWALAHCVALVLYGFRLNAYLLYRELCIPKFRKMGDNIEEKSNTKGGRLSRTPFVLGCSFLYFCLVAPLVLSTTAWAAPASGALSDAFKVCISLVYAGWAIAVVGDTHKSIAKASGVGLVTGGVYQWLRHPNYTGEFLLWTASFAAACVSFAALPSRSLQHVLWLVYSGLGCLGIDFVLMQATRNLEKRQREAYGDSEEYGKWVAGTWAGFSLKENAVAKTIEDAI